MTIKSLQYVKNIHLYLSLCYFQPVYYALLFQVFHRTSPGIRETGQTTHGHPADSEKKSQSTRLSGWQLFFSHEFCIYDNYS